MKKILLIVMLLTSTLILGACSKDKNPMISNPDSDYMSVKEGSNTYTVKNRRIYEVMKNQVGYTMIKDMIDTDLLKNTKNSNGVSYWDLITTEMITERFEEDVLGDEELTEEEKKEKIDDYKSMLFSDYGLITDADINAYYKLLLARDEYARDLLEKQIAEEDFTETEYNNYFNNNYRDEYHAIIVSFDSYRMLENSMKQLGYKFTNADITYLDGTPLSNKQIALFFIQLYNMVNAHKADGALELNEGVEYTLSSDSSSISFDLENDKLHYTYREISLYESKIKTALDGFNSYSPSADNYYTKQPQVYNSGARYSLFMKINQKDYTLEAVKSEIKEALTKQKLTTTFIRNKMLELRVANNIELYDRSFINQLTEELSSLEITYEHDKTDSYMVAKTDFNEYNADELFALMNRSYGISSATSELEFNRFLGNLDINTVYNFETKKAIDQDRWDAIQQSIKDEKSNFESDMYAENGYPANIGWKTFIKEVYGAEDEDHLSKFFVFQEVNSRYAKTFGSLEGMNVDSPRWQFYVTHMQKIADEYFNVTGVHLLISINDASGNPVNPEDWSDFQIEAAKDFYKQVMDYINDDEITDIPSKKIENVQNALNRAPYYVPGVPASEQPVIEGMSYKFNDIEVARFKSAGLVALFQDLGTFTNGSMVKEFNDAAKSVWDANSDSSDTVVYASTPDEEGNYEYLVTQFGYHIYVNTKTTPIVEYASGKVIPELADAIEFIKDNNTTKLTTKYRTALQTYLKPIHTELTSTNYVQIVSYKAIKDLDISLHHDDYTKDDYIKFLELIIEKKEESIKYK